MSTTRSMKPRTFVPRIRKPGESPFMRMPSQTPTPSRSKTSITCSNEGCPKPNIIEDDGKQVCATCGAVARDQNIVSEVQFGETSSGAAAVQGSYVGEGRTHGISSGGPGPGHGRDGLTSRELSALNAKREIDALILNLRVPSNLCDAAVNIFKLSLAHAIYDNDGNTEKDRKNFVQGRSIRTVAAVALYIACRRSKGTNTVMLIDIAENMTPQVSVFKMGNIYNRMVRAIWGCPDGSVSTSGYVDPINPENLIRRFARDLEFGPLVGKVTDDAIKLVQRMDRDWMTTGRRPAGICGAALILAARMNNFRRTVREVVLVVKVCEVTVSNRLEEFQQTAASQLTVQQMRQGAQTAPSDPPAFTRGQKKEKQPKKRGRKRRKQETAAEIEEDEEDMVAEDEGRPKKRGRVDKDGFAIPDVPIDPALQSSNPPNVDKEASQPAGSSTETSKRKGRPRGAKNKHAPEPTIAETALEAEIEHDIRSSMQSEAMQGATSSTAPPTRKTPGSDASDEDSEHAETEVRHPERKEIRMDAEILDDEFEDDPDVANAVLSEQEVLIKEHIWVEENKQWLRDEHAKRIKKQLQDAADLAAGITPGQSNKKKRRRGKRLGDVSYLKDQERGSEDADAGDLDPAARSRRAASIAMKGMLEHRGYSRRLNYDALSKMFPDDVVSIRAESVQSRRSTPKRNRQQAREASIAATNITDNASSAPRSPSETPAPEPSRPPPEDRRLSTETPRQTTDQLATPSNTQVPTSIQARPKSPLPAPIPQKPASPPPTDTTTTIQPPGIEGEEELIGVLSDTDSPLSSMQAKYDSPLIGTPHGGGFGEEEDDDDEDADMSEEEDADDDGVDKAFQGRFNQGFGDEDDG